MFIHAMIDEHAYIFTILDDAKLEEATRDIDDVEEDEDVYASIATLAKLTTNPEYVATTAKRLFKYLMAKGPIPDNHLRNPDQPQHHLVLGCHLIASRYCSTPKSVEEFCKLTGASEERCGTFSRTFSELKKSFDLVSSSEPRAQQAIVANALSRFCSQSRGTTLPAQTVKADKIFGVAMVTCAPFKRLQLDELIIASLWLASYTFPNPYPSLDALYKLTGLPRPADSLDLDKVLNDLRTAVARDAARNAVAPIAQKAGLPITGIHQACENFDRAALCDFFWTRSQEAIAIGAVYLAAQRPGGPRWLRKIAAIAKGVTGHEVGPEELGRTVGELQAWLQVVGPFKPREPLLERYVEKEWPRTPVWWGSDDSEGDDE
ncbi:uncharacterized protein BDZ99DRAFT_474937 [Mytilinidion resinicola]|uniref:Uncharacterized protein n=1 Tax=Mytilinidion resinicola TaxID=574789 RepID=A0A6A6YS39_9PEZI|nr:uncharacterized protein BDZ99DRAFT_474937 [Mytilinidion resinicola]KAF2811368.1 hypothetical protein BDZ99DRAFT_474937 [Mytilinidion resinicola]